MEKAIITPLYKKEHQAMLQTTVLMERVISTDLINYLRQHRLITLEITFYGTRYLSHCCALAYFAVKRFFCNIEKLRWSTRVRMLPHLVSSHVIGHVPIRSAVDDFL